MHTLRYRQIHLDFHTSPDIPDIGARFDRNQWQEALRAGHVDSVTTFAKCHHGWSYHETAVGKMHPHLGFDLLRAQFDASKAIDVNVPIYVSAGVDNLMSLEHPEWREVGADGRYTGWAQNIVDPGFHMMCFNTPYLDFLCEQIREVVRLFPECDGIFLDIIAQGQCCCKWCLAVMEEHGLEATQEQDRRACANIAMQRYYQTTTAACKCDNPDMPVFHNSGHVSPAQTEKLRHFSHLELESLPTGGWGYDHFPISAKYCENLPLDTLGMTGKFHTTWGEFGGYKHPNALRYECAAMIAFGTKCSVGDQLHPNGQLDPSTYALVGEAYAEVEKSVPWCVGSTNVADIGLLSAESVGVPRDNAADIGANRILLETHALYDVLDPSMDFDRYRALILPDLIDIDDALKAKLDAYLAQGGKLLLSGASGLSPDGSGFLFDVGASYEGEGVYEPDYLLPREDLRASFVDSPLVMYLKAHRIRVTDGESLGDVYQPYFNRTFRHFCSHQHTPPRDEPSGYACGVRKGGIVYLAHPAFSVYAGYGAVAYKEYLGNVLDSLLGEERTLRTDLPSTGRVTLRHQAAENRDVLHLLYADKISRGGSVKLSGGNLAASARSIEIVDELRTVLDTRASVRPAADIARITLEPEGRELDFEINEGRVEFTIDAFTCHAMAVLHHAD